MNDKTLNAKELHNSHEDDIQLFRDNGFLKESLLPEEESMFNSIQIVDLSEAKGLFTKLPIESKIKVLRYIFSHRLFDSQLLADHLKENLQMIYDESYGSLCAMDEHGTASIAIESSIITRILYITESLSTKEFLRMEHDLIIIDPNYKVILEVIKSRLCYHKKVMDKKNHGRGVAQSL